MSARRRLFQGASCSPAILLLVASCVLQVAHMVNGEFFPAGTTVSPSVKSGLGWCRPPPFCYARPRIQDPYDCENYSDCCGRRVSATKCGAGSTCNVGCKPGCSPFTRPQPYYKWRTYSCQRRGWNFGWGCRNEWRCAPNCAFFAGRCPVGRPVNATAKCGAPPLPACTIDNCCAKPLTCASFPASQCQPGQIYRPNKPCANGRCTSSQCCEARRCSNYTGGCGADGFAVDPGKPCAPAGCNEATCCVNVGKCSEFIPVCGLNGSANTDNDPTCQRLTTKPIPDVPFCSIRLCCPIPLRCNDPDLKIGCRYPNGTVIPPPWDIECGGTSEFLCNEQTCCFGISTETTCPAWSHATGIGCSEVGGETGEILDIPCGPLSGLECSEENCCSPSPGPPPPNPCTLCEPPKDACTLLACNATTNNQCEYSAVNCDDNDQCTIDSCDLATGCKHTNVTCDDDDPCTTNECDPDVGCIHRFDPSLPGCTPPPICTPEICDDGNPCTVDTCTDTPTGINCSYTDVVCLIPIDQCKSTECLPAFGCVTRTKDCNDDNLCTADSCNPLNGSCVHTPIPIEDGNQCTKNTCDPQLGPIVEPIECTSTDRCIIASCDPATGCIYEPVSCPANCPCTEGVCVCEKECTTLADCPPSPNRCTNPSCVDGECSVTIAPACPGPFNPCVERECENNCTEVPKNCSDGNACTLDTCSLTSGCQHEYICDDQPPDECKNWYCDPKTGCFSEPVVCPDDTTCTKYECDSVDGCVPIDQCTPAPPAPCTEYTCDQSTQTCKTINLCDDGITCTTDTCNNGVCESRDNCQIQCPDGVVPFCNATSNQCECPASNCQGCPASDSCTIRACNATTNFQCVSTPVTCEKRPCEEGRCVLPTGCVYKAKTCDSVDACKVGTCNATTDSCRFTDKCKDNKKCTLDKCDALGNCFFEPIKCPAQDTCSTAACSEASGNCTYTANNAACNDDDKCTSDTCIVGQGCEYKPIKPTSCTVECGTKPVLDCLSNTCICKPPSGSEKCGTSWAWVPDNGQCILNSITSPITGITYRLSTARWGWVNMLPLGDMTEVVTQTAQIWTSAGQCDRRNGWLAGVVKLQAVPAPAGSGIFDVEITFTLASTLYAVGENTVQMTPGAVYPYNPFNPAPGQFPIKCGLNRSVRSCTARIDTNRIPPNNATYPADKPRVIYWLAHSNSCQP